MRNLLRLTGIAALLALVGCQSVKESLTRIPGKETHVYVNAPIPAETGIASWYGGKWIGRLTANGETYRQGDITAAHKRLPFHTPVRVTDLKTGKSLIVRINNRGPFIRGRIIDLSVDAAKNLGTYDRGLAKVQIQALREVPVMSKPNMRALLPRPEPSPSPTPVPAKTKPAA
ncbi:MAG: septal ring lytic transglycosylase RlpA family protein [Verrucomicrobiota bacterium]